MPYDSTSRESNVPSLFDLAKKVCIRNVESIDSVGPLPYNIVRPILIKLQNPNKLRTIEKNSPQIAEYTEELWMHFIKRDFGPDAATKYSPKNPNMWHKVYSKLSREAARRDERDKEDLKATFAALKQKKESRRTEIIDNGRFMAQARGGPSRNVHSRIDMPVYKREKKRFGGGGGGGGGLRGVRSYGGIKPPGVFKNEKLQKILTKSRF